MSPGKHELTNASQEDARPNNKQIKTGIHKPENFSTFEHDCEDPSCHHLRHFGHAISKMTKDLEDSRWIKV